jgi:hypothetical protein
MQNQEEGNFSKLATLKNIRLLIYKSLSFFYLSLLINVMKSLATKISLYTLYFLLNKQ